MDGVGALSPQRKVEEAKEKEAQRHARLTLRLSHTIDYPPQPTQVATLYLTVDFIALNAPHLLLGRCYWLHVLTTSSSPPPVLVLIDLLVPTHHLYCHSLTPSNISSSSSSPFPSLAVCPVLLAHLRSISVTAGVFSASLGLPAVSPTVAAKRLTLLSPFLPPPSSSPDLSSTVDALLPLFLQSSPVTSSSLLACDHFNHQQIYRVQAIYPPHPPLTVYRIDHTTEITVLPSPPPPPLLPPSPSDWLALINREIRGYDSALLPLLHSVRLSLSPPSPLLSLFPPPHVFLLHGLSGTGKTRLSHLIASSSSFPSFSLSSSDVFQQMEGEGEERIAKIFAQTKDAARLNGAAWLLIDDVDGICEVEEQEEDGEMERGLVACLSRELDELHSASPTPPVFVLFTTSRLNAVSPSLLRQGRIDQQLHLPALAREPRLDVLSHYTRKMHINGDRDALLSRVNDRLHGYVGADVEKLAREVSIAAISRASHGQDMSLTEADFDTVLQRMRPANLSDLEYRLPSDVNLSSPFAELFGMEEIIAELQTNIIQPLLSSLSSTTASLSMPSGLLLYGMSGVGKTSLALAVALATSLPPLIVQSTSIISSVLGQTEKNLSSLFTKARASSPSIVLIDQIDSFASSRSPSASAHSTRLLSALLQEMDGITRSSSSRIFVIATSSSPHLIDPALLRPGRLDYHVRIPPPGREQREAILRGGLRRMRVARGGEGLAERLAEMSEGCSGADLMGMMREAGLLALRRGRKDLNGVEAIDQEEFFAAARVMRPSLKKGEVETFPPGKSTGSGSMT